MKRTKTIIAKGDGYKLTLNIKLEREKSWKDDFNKEFNKIIDLIYTSLLSRFNVLELQLK